MGALDGKIAIVTGATSGIGEGIAKAFVSEGAQVVIAARRRAGRSRSGLASVSSARMWPARPTSSDGRSDA